MNNKAVTLSAVMAILAVFFVQSYVSSKEEEFKKKFGVEVQVVVAKKNITEMQTLDETMFELKRLPKRFIEPGAIFFQPNEEEKTVAKDMKKIAGTVANLPIQKGEQITFNKISEPSIRTGLSPQVTPGMRAMSVAVNETTGVGKLVKPGDRVDLIAIIDGGGTGKGTKLAKTVLQDIVVLAVGRNITNNLGRLIETDAAGKPKVKPLTTYDGFSSVTIEVTPLQAQTLALVQAGGSNAITLSLRNNDDTDKVGLAGVLTSDVLGADAERIPQRAPAQRTTKIPRLKR